MTNAQEAKLLRGTAYRQRIAEALFERGPQVPDVAARRPTCARTVRPAGAVGERDRHGRCHGSPVRSDDRVPVIARSSGIRDRQRKRIPAMHRRPAATARTMHAGQSERLEQDIGQPARSCSRSTSLTMIGDGRLLKVDATSSKPIRWLVNASSASVRTATPLGPFGRYGFASSAHAVPAISRCAHGRPPVNSFRNSAAVIEPAGPAAGVREVGDLALELIAVFVEESASATRDRRRGRRRGAPDSTHALRRPEQAARASCRARRRWRRSASRRRRDASRRACARTTGRRRGSAGLPRRC